MVTARGEYGEERFSVGKVALRTLVVGPSGVAQRKAGLP